MTALIAFEGNLSLKECCAKAGNAVRKPSVDDLAEYIYQQDLWLELRENMDSRWYVKVGESDDPT